MAGRVNDYVQIFSTVADTASHLNTVLAQNIAYAAYLAPKTEAEIAEELGITPVFIADIVADLEEYGFMTRVEGARHVSAALELDESGEFLRRALALGATLSMGHTDASYETAEALIQQGVTALTHTFNAMPPLHHRDGGAVAAGLLSDKAYCELICDGFHIAPHMVKLAYRLAGQRLTLITDSMEATGCADGEYSIAGNPVTVKDGKARTHDRQYPHHVGGCAESVRIRRGFLGRRGVRRHHGACP